MTGSLITEIVDSPIGPLCVEATEIGIVGLSFGAANSDDVVRSGLNEIRARRHIETALVELDEYLTRRRTKFEVPIDWSRSSGFRRDVLRELKDGVAYGGVITYGDLAARVGRPRAARAVGTAMATNPIAVIVPCHRVVRAGNVIGAYGGGRDAKKWLLELEGVLPLT